MSSARQGSTFVQDRAARDLGVPGRRALPSRWASQLGGTCDGERSNFFSCREKRQEKESASQRGQEKAPAGPQPLGSRLRCTWPLLSIRPENGGRRIKRQGGVSHLPAAACSPEGVGAISTAFTRIPRDPQAGRGSKNTREITSQGHPLSHQTDRSCRGIPASHSISSALR